MPTLHWIGKEAVVNHHSQVPYRTLVKKYEFHACRDEESCVYGDKKSRGDAKSCISTTNANNISENRIVHGDNLEALKSLMPEYEGRIKCIYIDPPYNTGNEQWVYNDNVSSPRIKKWLGQVVGKEAEDLTRHDKWLCMMYPRLKLLHKLLAEDGAIFISIDDNEQANLKLICDEIFGAGNFVMSITWRRTDNQANIGKIAKVAEYIYIYAKNYSNCALGKLPLSDKAKNEYRYSDAKGLFRRGILLDKTRGRKFYPKETKIGTTLNGPWMVTEEEFDKLSQNDEIYWTTEGDGQPYTKIYLSESKGQIPNNFWGIEFGTNQRAAIDLERIFGCRKFDFSKPTSLVESIISISSAGKSSIILDSFAGSGTTAHAVLNMNKQDGGNRKFILVEMEDYAETITAERVRRVMNGYGEGKNAVEGTGGSFTYYELGEPLFTAEGYLNESLPVQHIRQYIFYTETGENLTNGQDTEAKKNEDTECGDKYENTKYGDTKFCVSTTKADDTNPYFLGTHNRTDYYLYYKPGCTTTLDLEFLSSLQQKAEQYIIYADNCLLSPEFMQKNNIVFKKIPREIRRF